MLRIGSNRDKGGDGMGVDGWMGLDGWMGVDGWMGMDNFWDGG